MQSGDLESIFMTAVAGCPELNDAMKALIKGDGAQALKIVKSGIAISVINSIADDTGFLNTEIKAVLTNLVNKLTETSHKKEVSYCKC